MNLTLIKITISAAFVLTIPFFALSGDEGLIFYCPYDINADAAFAAGAKSAQYSLPLEFQPGIREQAILIGGTSNEKTQMISYSPEKNISMESGTLSFWLKPLDWDASSKGMNVIFQTGDNKNEFMIYKYWSDDNFLFLHGATSASDGIDGWEKGQWHHIVAVWGGAEIKLFIDGIMVCTTKTRFPFEPGASKKPLWVGLDKAIGKSLIDELRIYNRKLSNEEISSLYLKDAENVENESSLVTFSEKTPDIDGNIGNFEYSFSGCGFFNMNGKLSIQQSRYLLSYDRKNLYFGLVSNLDSKISDSMNPETSERIELFIVTDSEPKTLHRIVFTSDGSVFEKKNGENGVWEPLQIAVKNNFINGKWILEAAIPFSIFGEKDAPDGKTWKFNIGRIFTVQPEITSAAPVSGKIDDKSHFIKLNFRSGAPQIQLASLENMKDDYSAVDLSAKSANADSEIFLALSRDNKKAYGNKIKIITLFKNGKSTPWKAPCPPEKNLWLLRDFESVKMKLKERINGKETELYKLKYIRETSFNLKVLFFYTQERKRLFVSAKRNADGKIQVRFLRPDGTIAQQSYQEIPKSSEYFNANFDLDFTKLSSGLYTVKIDYLSPDGKAEEVYSQEYKIPGNDSPEFKKYTDIEAEKVPAPWTAVNTDGGKVSIWGRTYDFSNGFLFSSLKSQGKELLNGPALLRLNGKELSSSKKSELKKLFSSDVEAIYEKQSDFGAIKIDNKIKTSFDGYCEITMTMTPVQKDLELKTLSLDIPFHSSAATLVRDNRLSSLEGSKSGATGDYWCQDLFKSGGFFLWIGNEKVGFNWLAPSLENWTCKNTAKSVEIIRNGDTSILRFNLIDTSVRLDNPRKIIFGFTLTPSRSLDPKLLRMREAKDWAMWCQPWKYFAYPDYKTVYRDRIDFYLNRAMDPPEIFLYMGDSLTSPFSPEWGFWEEEWRKLDRYTYGEWTGETKDPKARNSYVYTSASLSSETFRNFLNHKRNEFFTLAKTPLHPKATSYYFDIGLNSGTPAWKDANGKEYQSLLINETRELALNVYRMIKRTGPKAKVYTHQGWLRAMPMQNFTDIICGGEGIEGQIKKDGSYYNILTPEMFRASFIPETWGIKMVFINILTRNMPTEQKLKFSLSDSKIAIPVLHSYGYCIVHDTDIGTGLPELNKMIWTAQDKIGWDANVKFFPYWENDAVKLLSPQSNRILASAYTNNGKILLAILNDTDKDENIKLKLDLDKLGVKKGLEGSDTWNSEKKYILSDIFEDNINARGFRLIIFENLK